MFSEQLEATRRPLVAEGHRLPWRTAGPPWKPRQWNPSSLGMSGQTEYHLGVGKGERARLGHSTPVRCLRTSHVAGCVALRMPGRGCAAGLLRAPLAWPEVPSPRPEPPKSSRRSMGNSVCVFTPAVRVSESFILTADCIKIPVVIGSGAVFSMRILNQAFCLRPERSASEYKDAGDGINRRIFPPLNCPPHS